MSLTDTTRKMASIRKIANLSPVENSDFLEVATMENLGWKVVVKKGEFKIGDQVIYLEIDSAINIKDLIEPLKFLEEKCTKTLFTGRTPETSTFCEKYVRIKTIKLRGQVSQGLILPLKTVLDALPTERLHAEDGSMLTMTFDGGEDWTNYLKIEVWDRLVEWYEEHSQLGPRAQSHAAGTFPSDCPRTDEPRLQGLMEYFTNPEMTEADWECTVKNDGSSCTLFHRPMTWNPETGKDAVQIASRRFLLKDDGGSDDWFEVFKRQGWDELKGRLEMLYEYGLTTGYGELPANHELAIQGEMTGPRFNGNRDKNTENHFRVFRIFDITDQKFLSPGLRYAVCNFLGLEHVKVLEICKIFHKLKTLDDFLAYVDGPSESGNNKREGVVFKRVDDGTVSFKVVSNNYLLKCGD